MADPLSLATGLLTLFTFAYSACQTLLREIEAFENQPKDILYLKSELESLKFVLDPLFAVICEPGTDTDADLVGLKPPLLGCGEACKDMGNLIRKCTKHSDGKRPSLRDWASLKLRADQIKSVRSILSVYKSTITLALANATLGTTRVTKNVLDEYNKVILHTTNELNEHIRDVDNRLNSLPLQDSTTPHEMEELQRLLREKGRINQCLYICRQVSETINNGQMAVIMDDNSAPCNQRHTSTTALNGSITADEATFQFLDRLSLDTRETRTLLEKRDQFVKEQLKCYSFDKFKDFDEITAEHCQRTNERDSLLGCLSVCENASQRSSKARINTFEDIHASDGADQCVISDIGDLLSAKNIKANPYARQYLGQMKGSPFSNPHGRSAVKKPRDLRSSSITSVNEHHRARNLISVGIHPNIHDLKNLLLLIIVVVLLRNA